jgi:hypothetical protein
MMIIVYCTRHAPTTALYLNINIYAADAAMIPDWINRSR